MKRWIRAIAGGVAVCLVLSFCGFAKDCDAIRNEVVRLHILAHSDSEADQALKIKVRDAVTEKTAGWLDGVEGEEEALKTIERNLPLLQQTAEKVIEENGYSYPVTVSLGETYFSTRVYGDVTMPAGTYTAVRIEIGEAAGKNWWCVVYPPMCIRSAVKEQRLSDVLSSREMSIVSGENYVVRFKVVEIFQWLFQRFGGADKN